jgi:hypothetical protein
MSTSYHFRTFLACFTRFSITPSNASRSPNFSSVRFVQYSKTSFAVPSIASNFLTYSFNSSIVRPFNASSVIVHNCLAETRSRTGAGGGPFLLLESDLEGLPWESTDVEEALPSPCLRRDIDRESVEFRGEAEEGLRFKDGRTSFFCFDAGRISSRSTGTPKETRNRRRIRERIQSGGCRGGGATSWVQREALRGVKNMGCSALTSGMTELSILSGGKRAFMYGSVAASISSGVSSSEKSRTG